MLDTIRTAVSEFALGESGRVEQQKALPFAWTAGMLVGAAAVVSAPGVGAEPYCDEKQLNWEECTEGLCASYCGKWDSDCESRCITEHVCDCY